MMATTIRLACVPEQVNIPISLIKELKIDEKYQANLQVTLVPEGTGKMLELLDAGVVDIAFTVSDACMVARSKGRNLQLAGVYSESSLVWAIAGSPHLPTNCLSLTDLMTIRRHAHGENVKLRVGISRPGSGSQTMASYMAMLHNLDYRNGLEFVVANNFAGLKAGVQNDDFDVFLWETFTTKPSFDANEVRKLGEVPTPWPAFSCVTSTSINSNPDLCLAIKSGLFPAIFEATQLFTADKAAAVERIVREHGHKPEDASAWLEKVQYCSGSAALPVKESVFADSVRILWQIGLVPEEFQTDLLWCDGVTSNPIVTLD
jgi:ABC-type nitrate/sulfonate/bicarbonate transport system substrate-binding protein